MNDKAFQRALKNQQRAVAGAKTEDGDRVFWLVLAFLGCVVVTGFAIGKLIGWL